MKWWEIVRKPKQVTGTTRSAQRQEDPGSRRESESILKKSKSCLKKKIFQLSYYKNSLKEIYLVKKQILSNCLPIKRSKRWINKQKKIYKDKQKRKMLKRKNINNLCLNKEDQGIRGVSRKVLDDRQIEAIISGGPKATKYNPNFELTKKGITKSIFIGNEKEIEHKKQL